MSEEKILNLNKENTESSGEKEERASIIDFVNKYNKITSDKAKEALIQSIVRSNDYYVPYNEKYVYANRIIENSSFDKNGKVHYNGAKQYQLYIATILTLYTKFDIPGDNFSIVFDILNQKHLLDIIVGAMPDDKMDFDVMLNIAKDDFEKNYEVAKTDINILISAIKTGMLQGMESIMDACQGVLDNPELLNVIKQNFEH